jgi:hypothetical protein
MVNVGMAGALAVMMAEILKGKPVGVKRRKA